MGEFCLPWQRRPRPKEGEFAAQKAKSRWGFGACAKASNLKKSPRELSNY
jgi:hypothetical protein